MSYRLIKKIMLLGLAGLVFAPLLGGVLIGVGLGLVGLANGAAGSLIVIALAIPFAYYLAGIPALLFGVLLAVVPARLAFRYYALCCVVLGFAAQFFYLLLTPPAEDYQLMLSAYAGFIALLLSRYFYYLSRNDAPVAVPQSN